jgi:hypothetical protein
MHGLAQFRYSFCIACLLLLTASLIGAENKPDLSTPVKAPKAGVGKPVPQSGGITKAQVAAVMAAIDKALLKKNATGIVAHYASNAVSTATIIQGGETNQTRHGRQDYKETLEAGFKSFGNYTLERKELVIEIAPDGKTARCTSTLIEKYSFDGKMQQAVSKQSASFLLIDGKVLITQEHSDVVVK